MSKLPQASKILEVCRTHAHMPPEDDPKLSKEFKKTLVVFKNNLAIAIARNITEHEQDVFVNVPVSFISDDERVAFKDMLHSSGWLVKFEDHDYFNVVPHIQSGETPKEIKEQLFYEGRWCIECDTPTEFVDASIKGFRSSKGMIYNCPKCGRYVSCHPGTAQSCGTIADDNLRKMRRATHSVIDALWRTGAMDRRSLYFELAKEMGMPKARCHVGMFDTALCTKAQKAAEQLKRRYSN